MVFKTVCALVHTQVKRKTVHYNYLYKIYIQSLITVRVPG